jgi:ornithine cyclodeaminase/alanine dehydrogenase-like protein (mu-crystallin family)
VTTIRVLSRDDVAQLLDHDELRQSLTTALIAQSAGKAMVPARIAAAAPDGLLATMPGYLDADGGVLATKVVSIFPGHDPSHQGVIDVFDAATGTPLCIMDAEQITEDRTAMTAALAADRMARPDATVLAIVGAGAQGEAHGRAFAAVRRWSEIRISSRSNESAERLVHRIADSGTDADVRVVPSIEGCVTGADVIALCTHADEPVIRAEWVAAGAHVSSVGSQAELPRELVDVGHLVVDQRGAAATPPPSGAAELQHLDADDLREIGEVLGGERVGRPSPDSITVYKSTGHAVQDLAASALVLRKAEAQGIGTLVDL